tara:strand:+ start:55 stop:318 length:264 start_codon:yes stop_codon:yes gene_type:complete
MISEPNGGKVFAQARKFYLNFNTESEAFLIKMKCQIRPPKSLRKSTDSCPSSSEDTLPQAMVDLAPDQAKDLSRLLEDSTNRNRTKI